MAKIWAVYEGSEPTIGEPWAEMALPEAIELFGLQKSDFVSPRTQTPRFGNVERDLTFAGYRNIVVEAGSAEAKRVRWQPGFYLSRIKPSAAFDKLLERAFRKSLGDQNVQSVKHEPATDSRGNDAIRIVVAVGPGAAERLRTDAALDALLRVQDQLKEMRDTRTPLISYVTEADRAPHDHAES
jgi:hypothetical protein